MGLVVVAAAVGGCVTQADFADVRRDQRAMQRQLADTRATLDGVQRDLAATRGKVQETRYAERAQSRVDTLEARVTALEQGRPPVSSAPAEPTSPEERPTPLAAATPVPDRQAVGGRPIPPPPPLNREESEQGPEPYRAAVALVQKRDYNTAIQQLRDFVRRNPESPLAGNAHYWIGESYLQLGDYQQAFRNFNEVLENRGKNDRAPSALFGVGIGFLQMGNVAEARLAFQQLMKDYPASPEAGQAREKLKTLGA